MRRPCSWWVALVGTTAGTRAVEADSGSMPHANRGLLGAPRGKVARMREVP